MRRVAVLLLLVLSLPQVLPAQVPTLAATPGNQSVRLTWTPAGTEGLLFRLYRRQSADSHFVHVRSFLPTTTEFQDPVDAAIDGPFTYFLTAHTRALDTAFSNQIRLAPNPQGGVPTVESLPPPPPNAVTPVVPQQRPPTAAATAPLALQPLAWNGAALNTTSTISFSPDGQQLAVSSPDSVRLYSFPALKLIQRYPVEKRQTAADVQFSPDGQHLAVLSYRDLTRRQKGKMALWDLKTRKRIRNEGPPDEGQRLVFSSSGRYLAITATDDDWALWDLREGKKRKRPFNQYDRVHTVTFSLDERYVALSYRKKQDDQFQEMIAVLAFPDGEVVHEIASPATPCAFSPDGLVLAYGTKVGDQTQMLFLDTVTWAASKTLYLPHTLPQIVTYSPSGIYLATVALSGVVFRNVTADTLHFSLPGPAPVRMAYPTRPRLLAAVDPAGNVAFWKTPETMVAALTLNACTTLPACIAGVQAFPPVREQVEEQASRILTSLADARQFDAFFPGSRYADQALRLTADRVPREAVPDLLALFAASPEGPFLQGTYIQRSRTVAEAVAAARRYPAFKALAEARAAPLVNALADAITFAQFFTNSTYADAILERLRPTMERDDVPAYLSLFPQSTLVPALQANYVTASPSVPAFLEAAQRFPGHVADVETAAAGRVKNVPDAAAFIGAFPQSALADTLARHLALALPRTDLPALIPLFPNSAPVLKKAYLDRSQTAQDYADAGTRFPELATEAEAGAAERAQDAPGYIAYLMAFPEGRSARRIRQALAQAPVNCTLEGLTQPENLYAFLAFLANAPEEPNPTPSLFQKPVLGPMDYVEVYLDRIEGALWEAETAITDSVTQAITAHIQALSAEIDAYLSVAAPKYTQCTAPRLTFELTRGTYDVARAGFPMTVTYSLENAFAPSAEFFFAPLGLDFSQVPLPPDSLFLHVPNRTTAEIFERIQSPITGTAPGPATLSAARALIPYQETGNRAPLILSLSFAKPLPDPLPAMRTQLYTTYPYLQDQSTLTLNP